MRNPRHLDLIIIPAKELQASILRKPDKVAGPVDAGQISFDPDHIDKSFAVEIRTSEVAAGHTRTADGELAKDARRHRLPARVKHMDRLVLQAAFR